MSLGGQRDRERRASTTSQAAATVCHKEALKILLLIPRKVLVGCKTHTETRKLEVLPVEKAPLQLKLATCTTSQIQIPPLSLLVPPATP